MTGLTNEQVQERIAEGKVNVNENPNTRTYKQIILENTLTFFNFLNIALLVLDRKSTRLNSSHANESRMPSSA